MDVKNPNVNNSVEPGKIQIRLTNKFGETIILENPKAIKPCEHWTVSKTAIRRILQIARQISKKRGQILTNSIHLENDMDYFICFCLFGHITEEYKLFESVILRTNFVSLMNKWNILRGMLHAHLKFKDKSYSSLTDTIRKLIRTRDIFAHGIIVFKGKKPFIRYYNTDKKEQADIELTSSYFSDVNTYFLQASEEFQKIISTFARPKQ